MTDYYRKRNVSMSELFGSAQQRPVAPVGSARPAESLKELGREIEEGIERFPRRSEVAAVILNPLTLLDLELEVVAATGPTLSAEPDQKPHFDGIPTYSSTHVNFMSYFIVGVEDLTKLLRGGYVAR